MRALALVLLVSGAAPAGPARANPAEEPALARLPQLSQLVPAQLPVGTTFPKPEVEVLLDIDVSEAGEVDDVRVTGPAGEPFDSAARDAAKRFVFEPALLTTGEAVPVTISFRMRIQEPPPPPVQPDPAKYAGRLLERGTRKPLAGVELSVQAGGRTTARGITSDDGRFSLSFPPGEVRVKAVSPGHEALDAALALEPGEEREELIYLEPRATGFETVVTASAVRREVTKQVIPKAVVETLAGTQGDTVKVVQNLPGVARPAFGGGALVLRGAAPGDSRTFLEGQEIPSLYHFAGIRSTFNSAFLDSVEFFPGNFSPDYGRATGGVVDVKVRDPASDLFRGQVDVNLYDAGFALEGPVSKSWSVGGAFHRSYIDSLLPVFLPEDVPLTFDTAPRYYDYQFLATWKPDPKQRLRLLFYGSQDSVKILFDRPSSDPQVRGALSVRSSFHSLQANYRSELPWGLTQETSLQVGIQSLGTQIGPDFFFNLDVSRLSFRTTFEKRITSSLAARAGMDLRQDWVDIALNSPNPPKEGETSVPTSASGAVGVAKSSALYQPAAFAEVSWKPVRRLEIIPSLRIDWYRDIARWTFDPRVSARLQVADGTTLAAGAGLYQQPPAPDESDEDTGNPALSAERSAQASVGVEQRLRTGLDLAVTGFYKNLDRLVVRNPAIFRDPNAPIYVSDGSGRIFGVEAQLKADLFDRFNGWIAYTFQRSFRTDGPDREERLFDFDQPHILTLVGSYRIGAGWSAGARFRLVSGNPETPVAGNVYDAGSGTFVPLYGPVNSDRLAVFHQLDVRVDKNWTFDTWKLGLYVDVQNVYNRGNQEGWSYNFDYTQRQPLTGLPILPILGAKGEW